VDCDLKSQNIERRCDERETRRMKAQCYKARRNKAKLSFLSYRRATCFYLLWAANTMVLCTLPSIIHYHLSAPCSALPRQFSCTPYNKCSGFEPLSCRREATESLVLNLHSSQEQAFRTASNSKYGMNVSHSFKCAQLTKPG
jgi:hypothetical protein